MNKTHPWAKKYGYEFGFQHAECMAIKNFPCPYSELSKCKLINIRLISKDKVALSKPCVNCANLLSLFNVGEVWYTTNSGLFVKL